MNQEMENITKEIHFVSFDRNIVLRMKCILFVVVWKNEWTYAWNSS